MLRALALLSLTASPAISQIFLAWQGSGSGCIFLGHYDQGRFIDTTKTNGAIDPYTDAGRTFVPPFTAGAEYPAITASGAAIRVRVTEVSPRQNLPTWKFHADTSEPALIGSAPLPLEVLRPAPTQLSRSEERQILARAKQLWERALSERASGDAPVTYTLGKPQIATASGMKAIYYPLEIEPLHDRRGSMFFLYSEQQHRIVRAEFGHPAWAFQSSARTIRPEFYFRLKNSSDVYFVAEYSGGWEDWGYAILNLRTGKTELYCY